MKLFILIFFCFALISAQEKTRDEKINYISNISYMVNNVGLVAHFPFNGNANDVSGNNFNGNVIGATLTNDRFGIPNKAYFFNGSSYIRVENFNANLIGNTSFSVSFWIKPVINNNGWILAFGIPEDGKAFVCGNYFFEWNKFYATIWKGFFQNYSQTQIDTNFTFITVTYDGSLMKVYKNSILSTSQNIDYVNVNLQNGNLHIGKQLGGYDEYFKGIIDDVRIYNRVIENYEISYLYNYNIQDTSTNWRMQIVAQIGNAIDEENYVGVADSATEGFDPIYDIPEPPFAPGNYISAYFNHPEWNVGLGSKFAYDIKHNSDIADTVKRWYFDVETNVINDTVTLIFNNDRIPEAFGKYLKDLTTGQRINLKLSSNYKYYNTSTSSRKFVLIIGDSTAPQLSFLYPNGSEIFNSETIKNINWQSSDGTGIDSIFIYVSSDAGTNYNLLKQVGDIQTTTWQIPNEYLNHNYSIKIFVRDSLGNQSTDKSEKTFTVVGDSLEKSISAGWSLISSPLNPNDSSLASIFGDDFVNNPYYLWEYKQNVGYKIPEYFNFKNGYWLGALFNNNWDVRGKAIESDSTIQTLAYGYNIIGNNFVREILKNNLLFQKNNIQHNFSSAVSNGLISNTIFGYNGNGYVSKDTLELFKGYWLAALQEDVYLIQKPKESSIVPDNPKIISPTNWEVPFTLISNNLQDMIAVLGVKEDATSNFDVKYDVPRPPRNPGNDFLELYFENSGNNYPHIFGSKYAIDFRQPENATWIFKIESSNNSTISLTWNNNEIFELPDSIEVILQDVTTNEKINMKIDSIFVFEYNGPKTFIVNSTITNIGESKFLPTEYSLSQNYPNPFNPTTSISFQLPYDSKVELIIYDVLGNEVAILVNEYKTPGSYQVSFDGKGFSSGIYFYKLTAGDFVSVKKMILMK